VEAQAITSIVNASNGLVKAAVTKSELKAVHSCNQNTKRYIFAVVGQLEYSWTSLSAM